MTEEINKLQIKLVKPEIPEIESDRTLFALFDFLLTDKSQPILEKKSEAIKIIEPLV